MEVMTRMIHQTGRCPLPVHDSFLVADIDAEDLSQTMKEVAREKGLKLKVKESKAVSTTIDDLIGTQSPLVALSITPLEHHPPSFTVPTLQRTTTGVVEPQLGVLTTRYTSLCPTPGIQLEVTTPDLQGQKLPNSSTEPRHETRKRESGTHTTTTDPTSPVRVANWHDPPESTSKRMPSTIPTADTPRG
jgi:hypothetical protein